MEEGKSSETPQRSASRRENLTGIPPSYGAGGRAPEVARRRPKRASSIQPSVIVRHDQPRSPPGASRESEDDDAHTLWAEERQAVQGDDLVHRRRGPHQPLHDEHEASVDAERPGESQSFA